MPAMACNVAATSVAIDARTVYSWIPGTRVLVPVDAGEIDGAAEAMPAAATSPAAAALDNNSRRVIEYFCMTTSTQH